MLKTRIMSMSITIQDCHYCLLWWIKFTKIVNRNTIVNWKNYTSLIRSTHIMSAPPGLETTTRLTSRYSRTHPFFSDLLKEMMFSPKLNEYWASRSRMVFIFRSALTRIITLRCLVILIRFPSEDVVNICGSPPHRRVGSRHWTNFVLSCCAEPNCWLT